jgi:SAM-dependent methyltransferase
VSLETVSFTHFQLEAGDRVLDLGCGEGRHAITAYLTEEVHAVGVDMSFDDLDTARSRFEDFRHAEGAGRLSLAVADGTRLPFPDASFDKVICAEVLEHVPNYHAMLGEIRRVLKPSGALAVSVPRFGPEWICWQLSTAYHEVEGGHVRIFQRSELKDAVEAQGFRLYRKHHAHALHSPYWWLKCLFWAREEAWLVRQYHRFLVWDLMKSPVVTRLLERLLNPVMGKSLVMYFGGKG